MTVDEYISQFPAPVQQGLRDIRTLVQKHAAESVECIAYGMPAYKLRGKPLIYYAGFEHHVGLYATPSGHVAFAKQFAPYKQGKGSVQFPHDQPLPLILIKKVIVYRVEELS